MNQWCASTEPVQASLDLLVEHLSAVPGVTKSRASLPPASPAARSPQEETQLVELDWNVLAGEPKTASGVRMVTLGLDANNVVFHHEKLHKAERLRFGRGWADTGQIFVEVDGIWLHSGKMRPTGKKQSLPGDRVSRDASLWLFGTFRDPD